MFFKRHLERMRSLFLDQFEADEGSVVFRKSMTGPPIRVSAAERDAFAAAFVNRVKRLMWALMVATLLLCVVPVLAMPDATNDERNVIVAVGLSAILTACLGSGYWAWTAPARALARRPVAGPARTKREVRERALAQVTYGQLALALLVAAIVAVSDGFSLWRGLLGGVVAVGAMIQAIRKLRLERSGDR
ncbi:hypothetical protein [Sphingomonas sp. VNH70]|uniref:hypothetical protein n=1 Tax=Sphingomonas silueang TaxID=3156617 RepID=UPI0032B4B659